MPARLLQPNQARSAHPRSVLSLSTSSSRLRRPIATIRPRPTTTSEAAIAITAIANTWPSSWPRRRANAIRARFAPLSMISTESRMISGLRLTRTPTAPVTNSRAATTRYQPMSGPCIFFQRPGVGPEHDAADGGDEQHDRGDFEREQVVGEEQPADRRRRAERAVDVRLVREAAARRQGERDDHLGEDRAGGQDGADRLPRRPARPRRLIGAVAEVGDHEQEHHHHRAAVDEHLAGGDELAAEQQIEDGERGEVADQRERREERVLEADHGEGARDAGEGGHGPDAPDDDVRHAYECDL